MTKEQQYWEEVQKALDRIFDLCEEIDPKSGYNMLQDMQFVRGFVNKYKPQESEDNMDYETLRGSMTVQDAARVLKETNCYGTMDIAKSVILKALEEQMSSSEKPNKWIPISKDVPTIGQEVLVCDFDGDMYITSLHLNGRWGFDCDGNRIKNIVAWMKLPLPYKAESEDEE